MSPFQKEEKEKIISLSELISGISNKSSLFLNKQITFFENLFFCQVYLLKLCVYIYS